MAQTLSPKQAAALLRKSLETLRRWRIQGKGPPFVMEGGKPRYRSDLLEAGSYPVQGRQVTFPLPAVRVEAITSAEPRDVQSGAGQALPIHRLVALINDWRRRELYRRAQKVLDEPFEDDDEFEGEFRMFGEPGADADLGGIAEETDRVRRQVIFTALDELETAVSRKLKAIWDAEGLPAPLLRQHYQVASTLLENAWREVFLAHERWRNLDYTGMPSEPPPPPR